MKTIVGSAEITACIGLVLSGPGAVPISAQTMVGSITGTVRDSSGSSAAVVPNAVVRIANEATGASRQTTTDGAPRLSLRRAVHRLVRLRVEMPSFKKFETTGIEVKVTQLKRVDGALELGELLQTVHVEETVPAIQTESPSLCVNVPKEALNRPLTNDSRGSSSHWPGCRARRPEVPGSCSVRRTAARRSSPWRAPGFRN